MVSNVAEEQKNKREENPTDSEYKAFKKLLVLGNFSFAAGLIFDFIYFLSG